MKTFLLLAAIVQLVFCRGIIQEGAPDSPVIPAIPADASQVWAHQQRAPTSPPQEAAPAPVLDSNVPVKYNSAAELQAHLRYMLCILYPDFVGCDKESDLARDLEEAPQQADSVEMLERKKRSPQTGTQFDINTSPVGEAISRTMGNIFDSIATIGSASCNINPNCMCQ